MQVINLKLESNMKEEMLEAIYGTVERLEQKVDELSASPKNTEAESTPVSVSVDTSKLEKAILAMAVKEGEAIDKLVRLREAICIFTDLTKKEASKDEQRSKLLFDTINQVKQELNATSKNVQDKLHAMGNTPLKKVVTHRFSLLDSVPRLRFFQAVLCLQQFLLCICHKNPSSLSFLPDDLIAQSVGKLDGLRVSQGLPLELV